MILWVEGDIDFLKSAKWKTVGDLVVGMWSPETKALSLPYASVWLILFTFKIDAVAASVIHLYSILKMQVIFSW